MLVVAFTPLPLYRRKRTAVSIEKGVVQAL
jgi:hypothetical protein